MRLLPFSLTHELTTLSFVVAMNMYNMNARIPTLFCSYDSLDSLNAQNIKIWEAARATSATPKLFPHIEVGRKQPFVDGSLGQNNPTRLVIEEAEQQYPRRDISCVLSIGAGYPSTIELNDATPSGLSKTLLDIVTDCEERHQDMLKRFAQRPDVYFRLNVRQGMQYIGNVHVEKLDDVATHTKAYLSTQEAKIVVETVVPLLAQGSFDV